MHKQWGLGGKRLICVTSSTTHHTHISVLMWQSLFQNSQREETSISSFMQTMVLVLDGSFLRELQQADQFQLNFELLIQFPEIVTLRMDNGRHLKNTNVTPLLESKGIQTIWSVPYKPETNGVAERPL